MNRVLHRVWAVVLCIVLLAVSLPWTVSAENYSGTCGEKLTWSFNSIRGILTISGTGAMDDYGHSPWYTHKMNITGVTIEDGVTYIGSNAFFNVYCKTIVLPDSVQSVGSSAIYNCPNLENVTISDGVRTIGNGNLSGCDALRTVHVSRFVREIGEGFLSGSGKAVLCATSEDCAAKRYADAHGISFAVCTHAEHTHAYTETQTTATCTQGGYTTYTCTICDESYTDSETPALGHAWQETGRTPPSCTEDGAIEYICAHEASHTKTEALAATGHTYEAHITAPTCTENGFTIHTCTTCFSSFTDSETPALGHRMEDGVCVRCGLAENWTYTLTDGCVTLTGYTAEEPFVHVPGTLGGKRVTGIADRAFFENTDIEFVKLPDSVASVGAEAFFGCTALREVFIGSAVTQVGYHAFAQCPNLAIFCTTAGNVDLRGNVFGNNDPRLVCIAPNGTATSAFLAQSALRLRTYSYPVDRQGKNVLAFGGETVLYGDLDYMYWILLAQKYPDAYYMRFDRLVFDGLSPDFVQGDVDSDFLDRDAESLTMRDVYVSIRIGEETITFDRLVSLLEDGQVSLAVSFDSEKGENLTIFQKIGGHIRKVFNALTKLLNSILRIFKKR